MVFCGHVSESRLKVQELSPVENVNASAPVNENFGLMPMTDAIT